MVKALCVAGLMIDLLDCLMAMGFRERAREEGEARVKYKRRGRWEGYSVWLALGNGPIMAGTHCPGYERGYGVRARRDFPACAVVSPCAPLLTRGLVRPHSYLRLPASQWGWPGGRYSAASIYLVWDCL